MASATTGLYICVVAVALQLQGWVGGMWGDQWVPQHKNYDFHPLMAPWGLILGDLIAGSPGDECAACMH